MKLIENIIAMRQERGLNQKDIAEYLCVDPASWHRTEHGKQLLNVMQLEKIANLFNCRVIDLYTYPKLYVDPASIDNHEKISVTFEISPDKRDVLLKLVTGNNNIKLVDQ